MNLSYIANNIKNLAYVQIGSRTVSLGSRTLSLEDACFIKAVHESGEVKLIPLAQVTEFVFEHMIPSNLYSVEKVDFGKFDYVVRSLTYDRPNYTAIKQVLADAHAQGKGDNPASIMIDLYSCNHGNNRFFHTTYHNGEISLDVKELRCELAKWINKEELNYLDDTSKRVFSGTDEE